MASELSNTKQFISWGIFIVCAILGIALFFLGKEHQKNQKETAEDVISQMNLIEDRFDSIQS